MRKRSGVLFLRDGTQLLVPCEAKHVSDGAHTFQNLYDQRTALFCCLAKANRKRSWRSLRHENGDYVRDGMFLAGMRLPAGDIAFHLQERFWKHLSGVEDKKTAPPWNGHTEQDCIAIMLAWCEDEL